MADKPNSLADVEKACHLRVAKCCVNCKWCDDYAEDYGANYQVFCSNPKNEFEDAKPGEDAYFSLLGRGGEMVCDNFEQKDML